MGMCGRGILKGPGNGTGKEAGDGLVGPFDSLRRFFDTRGDNRLSSGYPEFDPHGRMVCKPGIDREKENVAIRREHQGAQIIQSMDGGLEAVASDGLVLEWGMSMLIQVINVSEGPIELPQKIDKFAEPKGPGKVASIDHEGEEEGLLNCCPFAQEAYPKKLVCRGSEPWSAAWKGGVHSRNGSMNVGTFSS
jgi:hypothetical protein